MVSEFATVTKPVSFVPVGLAEREILTTLRGSLPTGWTIESARTLTPEGYDTIGAGPYVLLAYAGAEFDPSLRPAVTRRLSFVVLIGVRNLGENANGDDNDGYSVVDAVRRILTGLRVAVADDRFATVLEFWPTLESFTLEKDGLFWYALTIGTSDIVTRER